MWRCSTDHRRVVKFIEALWRCLIYLPFTLLGTYFLFYPSTAIWITDTKHHFLHWPRHQLSQALQVYYQVPNRVLSSSTAVDQSHSFWRLGNDCSSHRNVVVTTHILYDRFHSYRIIHSLATRHIVSDVFLEAAKILNYISKAKRYHRWAKTGCDVLFGIFALTFFITRLVLFPRHLIHNIVVESLRTNGIVS